MNKIECSFYSTPQALPAALGRRLVGSGSIHPPQKGRCDVTFDARRGPGDDGPETGAVIFWLNACWTLRNYVGVSMGFQSGFQSGFQWFHRSSGKIGMTSDHRGVLGWNVDHGPGAGGRTMTPTGSDWPEKTFNDHSRQPRTRILQCTGTQPIGRIYMHVCSIKNALHQTGSNMAFMVVDRQTVHS